MSKFKVTEVTETTKLTNLYNEAQKQLEETGTLTSEINQKYVNCLDSSTNLINEFETFNPFKMHRHAKEIVDTYYINAEILSRTLNLSGVRNSFTDDEKKIIYTGISRLQKVLSIDPFHSKAKELFKILFIYLTMYNYDPLENIQLLKNVLSVDPGDYQLQYNLGFMYQRANDLEYSLAHYKLALALIDNQLQITLPKSDFNLKQFKVKCLNGLGGIYFTIQDRELANYFFFKGLEILPNDPDLHNQIGVVYTELRYTDKAIFHYTQGIKNFKTAHISNDLDMLLASMHMNMGLAYCYEINYPKAIECYNRALTYKPRLSLAYQNKLLDLNYISHLIEDPMYIAKLHRGINKIYPKIVNEIPKGYKWKNFKDLKQKLNIGFVSGDFVCHPVSYFVSCILDLLDKSKFNVTCYSLKIMSLPISGITVKVVKGKSPEEFSQLIQDDCIDILFDLSSQTGDNRLDTFALKPAPVQISYCGYPNTSGLENMDYHIVDRITDSDGVTPGPDGITRPSTQRYYTEELLFMDHSFLNYTPSIGINNLPDLVSEQPFVKNGFLTIGTFNRYNKINDTVIQLYERILKECPTVRFVIKTKEFLTDFIKKQFLNTWSEVSLLERITIIPYSDMYTEHLLDYNKFDVALDTFPYSGTTTSCEALMMGVPVVTLFDSERQYHAQNVTSSLMANSGMPEYIVYSHQEYIDKIKKLSEDNLKNLKKDTREKFLKGHVTDYANFVKNFEEKIIEAYLKTAIKHAKRK